MKEGGRGEDKKVLWVCWDEVNKKGASAMEIEREGEANVMCGLSKYTRRQRTTQNTGVGGVGDGGVGEETQEFEKGERKAQVKESAHP